MLLFASWVVCMFLLSSADPLPITFFCKKIFRIIISVTNVLGPDQDLSSVGHDPGTNWLQRLSADDKSLRW